MWWKGGLTGWAGRAWWLQPPEKKVKVDNNKPQEPAKPKEAEQVAAAAAPVSSTTTIGKATVLGPIARAGEQQHGHHTATATGGTHPRTAHNVVLCQCGIVRSAALNKPSEPPTPLEFLMIHPEGLTALEVEVRHRQAGRRGT